VRYKMSAGANFWHDSHSKMFEKALTPGPVRGACISVLLRILLLGTWVNKGKRKGQNC
jgi:hypothetical protein